MMKTKTITKAIVSGILLSLHLCAYLSAQGQLSISHITASGGNEDVICGSNYTTILPFKDLDQQNVLKQDTWILRNDGDEPIQLIVPLAFESTAPNYLYVSSQPQSILDPGASTSFTTTYEYKYGNDQYGFLPITTIGTENQDCGILYGGTVETVSLCYCHCSSNNTLQKICPFGIEGFFGGVNVDKELCNDSNNDTPCNSFSLLGSCSCEDYRSINNNDLFIDTLVVNGVPQTDMILTSNNNSADHSFLNINGLPLRIGANLGTTDNTGRLYIPIYRRPNTSVNIMVNGVTYVSGTLCPDLSDCVEEEEFAPPVTGQPVPTLSEWSMILLSLLILIISLVAFKSPIKVKI